MSSIIFERNGVITAFLASSTEAETNFPALEAIPAIEASRDGDTAAYGEAVQSNQSYGAGLIFVLLLPVVPIFFSLVPPKSHPDTLPKTPLLAVLLST